MAGVMPAPDDACGFLDVGPDRLQAGHGPRRVQVLGLAEGEQVAARARAAWLHGCRNESLHLLFG